MTLSCHVNYTSLTKDAKPIFDLVEEYKSVMDRSVEVGNRLQLEDVYGAAIHISSSYGQPGAVIMAYLAVYLGWRGMSDSPAVLLINSIISQIELEHGTVEDSYLSYRSDKMSTPNPQFLPGGIYLWINAGAVDADSESMLEEIAQPVRDQAYLDALDLQFEDVAKILASGAQLAGDTIKETLQRSILVNNAVATVLLVTHYNVAVEAAITDQFLALLRQADRPETLPLIETLLRAGVDLSGL